MVIVGFILLVIFVFAMLAKTRPGQSVKRAVIKAGNYEVKIPKKRG